MILDFADRKAAIHQEYTGRLKAMSPADPAYRSLWDERADKLRALRTEQATADPIEIPEENE